VTAAQVTALRFSPDGAVLAVATRDKLVHLLHVEHQYRRLGSCRGHSTAVIRMDFSADGSVLQTNDSARELLFWDVATAKQVRSPVSTRDLAWASWTCLYGWPVQVGGNGSECLFLSSSCLWVGSQCVILFMRRERGAFTFEG
jgi:echinoderm microtubule-associated protein-like 1/2